MRPLALCLLALALSCKPPTPAVGARAHGDAAPCHCHDATATPRAQPPTPDTSVYLVEAPWSDQNDRPFRLASLAGGPAVVLMFYGTCQSVCPILIADVQRIEAALTPAARARTRFVLVTFDPSTDTAERLRALAAERHMDAARWSLLRGSDDDVRTFATVLGVQYSRVSPTEFTHSNVITLLDAQGVVSLQVEGLRQPVDEAARRIETLAR